MQIDVKPRPRDSKQSLAAPQSTKTVSTDGTEMERTSGARNESGRTNGAENESGRESGSGSPLPSGGAAGGSSASLWL
ncbi:hypothetical protein GCM10010172_53650 [Paractinoplanes ferrugineus]|uniref:Uncharacterized protein n=1 Tax=Paractinoplanes ferrugineus TaxID=113564 RepID=A0A919J1M9_9ACTN|nr:hypothetical protein Afe05nite_36570 [Actinoplanes ferrugineus]